MSVASMKLCPSLCKQTYHSDTFEDPHCTESAVLTIEEIKLQLYSCFSCGVSWLEDHVCLDCSECGGYSLQRPCLHCDGQCGTAWKRDLTMSHASGKARWIGTCQLQSLTSTALESTRNQSNSSPSSP